MEDQIQAQCYQWWHNTYPHYRGLLFAVPNGGHRDKVTANKLKATGVVPGIPDMLFMGVPGGKHGPAGIEFKTPTGGMSSEQKGIREVWSTVGLTVYIVRSFDQFQSLVLTLIA